MKIVSYNVNGIRAAMNKGLPGWLEHENPDILCVQETKAQPEQIDTTAFNKLGYFCFFHSAAKKGYSGVGIFTKIPPDNIVFGMDSHKYDAEGRVMRADFDNLTVISVYFPNGSSSGDRHQFKIDFLNDFQEYITCLRQIRPNIVVCGDYNICHHPIDIYNPEQHMTTSGFLPEERIWMDGYEASGMVDSFRVFDQSAEKYSWWDMRTFSRDKNQGWRIDYQWISKPLKEQLLSAQILTDAFHSDHCPVMLELKDENNQI
ncbi:MAG: exodeoxyribonuclease III [Paludibacteraceae bacterium]